MFWHNIIYAILLCAYIGLTFGLQRKIAENMQDKLAETNEALNELNEQIKLQMQMQTSFTNSMNHELRSPLNGILGNLEVLLLDEELNKEEKNGIQNAYNSGKTMLKTVNDLLDFAKLREGKFEIVPENFELAQMVSSLSGNFTYLAKQKNLDMKIEVKNQPNGKLFGDETRIEQIVNNLLSNAVKYTDTGYVKCCFSVETEDCPVAKQNAESDQEPVMLHVTVEDSGQGMATSDIDEIAEPFTRFNVKKNKNVQGTGLGMNIVKSLVTQMEGKITCNSALGQGTTFDVWIPVGIVNTTEEKDFSAVAADFSDISILCIDDTTMNLNLFKKMLEKTNAKIDTAESGADGLALALENTYDIIFVDHIMPGMDGIETFHKIKEDKLNQNTPFVMLSGNTGEEYQELYKKEGLDYFLGKPFHRTDIINLIHEAFQ